MTFSFPEEHNATVASLRVAKAGVAIMSSNTNPIARVIGRLEGASTQGEPWLATMLLAAAAHSLNPDLEEFLSDMADEAGTVKGRSKSVDPQVALEQADQYKRPNGEVYYSRTWGNDTDVMTLRKARDHDKYVIFMGPPGTGKTALAEAAFGEDLLTVVGSGDTEVADLIGSFIPNPDNDQGGYIWIDGPLVQAMEQGRPLLIDEIGLVDTKVLAALYGAIDGRRELVVTANPARGTVAAKKGFYLLGATNPKAPGVRLSEALLSRFVLQAEVTTDWKLAGRMGVPSKIIQIAENLALKQRNGEITWAPQFRELLAFRDVASIFGQEFALANLLAVCPEDDREDVNNVILQRLGQRVSAATI